MLVKTMEELGIGRPSTYAQIIDTITRRGYVELVDRRFVPTELGTIVVDLLKEHFPNIIDVEFTATMESQLDQIEEGKEEWEKVLASFWQPFSKELEKAEIHMEEVEIADEETDEICEKCGRNMVIKQGRYGRFLACPGFPSAAIPSRSLRNWSSLPEVRWADSRAQKQKGQNLLRMYQLSRL